MIETLTEEIRDQVQEETDNLLLGWKDPDTGERHEGVLSDPYLYRAIINGIPLRGGRWGGQAKVVRAVEDNIDQRTGAMIIHRSSRQTGKNEVSATIHNRALVRYAHADRPETIIKTAPTFLPQVEYSIRRLDELLETDGLIGPHAKWTANHRRVSVGKASILFLTAKKGGSVVGASASLLLDVDEAHLIDMKKYQMDFLPMTASTNAPIMLSGIAGFKEDLLYQQLVWAREHTPDLVFEFPASYWAERWPPFAKHYYGQVAKWGADHPLIKISYDLEDIDSLGRFLSTAQVMGMLNSEHKRQFAPTPGKEYIALIDIGGEEIEGLALEKAERMLEDDDSGKAVDSTALWIAEIDRSNTEHGWPRILLRDLKVWRGGNMQYTPAGGIGQQEVILNLLNMWAPRGVVVDSVGIGYQMSRFFRARYSKGKMIPYKASTRTVTEDLYSFLGMVNNDRIKMWINDSSQEYQVAVTQFNRTQSTIFGTEDNVQMKISKTSERKHIDILKALTYVARAIDTCGMAFKSEPDYGK